MSIVGGRASEREEPKGQRRAWKAEAGAPLLFDYISSAIAPFQLLFVVLALARQKKNRALAGPV